MAKPDEAMSLREDVDMVAAEQWAKIITGPHPVNWGGTAQVTRNLARAYLAQAAALSAANERAEKAEKNERDAGVILALGAQQTEEFYRRASAAEAQVAALRGVAEKCRALIAAIRSAEGSDADSLISTVFGLADEGLEVIAAAKAVR